MIQTRDGQPTQYVVKGQEYLVPTVCGVPVVLPSHVDEGNDGATSRHWHTDRRWGSIERHAAFWSKETCERFEMRSDDSLITAIIKDEGQQIVYKQLLARDTIIWPSGGVFSTVVWVYYKYGHLPAKDGHCAHHHTQLQEHNEGGLQCPAHGLRYKTDGSPRFTGPFYVRMRYRDEADGPLLQWAKAEVHFNGKIQLAFPVGATIDMLPSIELVDANDDVILQMDNVPGVTPCPKTNMVELTVTAWPSTGYCPSMVPTCN